MTHEEIQRMNTSDLARFLSQLNRVIEDAIQDQDPQALAMIQDVNFCNALLECRRLMENESFCEPAASLRRFDEMMQFYAGCEDALDVIDEHLTEFVCESCNALLAVRQIWLRRLEGLSALNVYLNHYASRIHPSLREQVRRAVIHNEIQGTP